ncbi:MAG: hypothetical protein P8I82_07950 [Flavobacteriales bacterium]|nr:hypothetical protein [Flavobacteriales bacterium]
MKPLFLFFFLFSFTGLSIAQEEWNREEFIEELREDVKDNDDRDHRRAGKQFLRYFEEATFDDTQEEYLHLLIKGLRRKRFNDAEDFHQLFRLLNHYGEGGLKDENLDVFLASSVSQVSELKHKTAKSYLKKCSSVLVDSVLHSTKTFQWKFTSGDFIFSNDSTPIITGEKLELSCISRLDTLKIELTGGYLDLFNHNWFGEGGQCNWTKHGISKDSISVLLNNYFIDLRKPHFEAEETELLGSLMHDENKLLGRFSDGLSSNSNREGAAYPNFLSYKDAINFKNIFEHIDVQGSLELRGKRMFLFGSDNHKTQLTFYHEDEPFIRALAKRFRMQDARIYAENTSVKLLWKNDSIVHPQLNLTFDDSTKITTFERLKINLGISPIRSSYHQLDCYFDRLTWDKDSTALFFSNDRSPSLNPALLESYDYYKESRYEDIATMDKRHPAFILKTLSVNSSNERYFLLSEIAEAYKYSVKDADLLMTNFAVLGFVDYDSDRETVLIKDKLFNFLDFRLENRDYDGLRMVSRSDRQPYAKMDLESGDLAVRGVNMVEVSDSNDVAIFPYEGEIVVHQNRDFTFDGIVQTGDFALYGKQMKFRYNPFEIELNKIDSLQYTISTGFVNQEAEQVNETVKTVISDITGTLYVDGPKNKSGLDNQPDFPKLHSYEEAHIYYDKIKKGVYKRELFSFKTDPFQFDSLLSINTESIEFTGRLNAPTIFPSFIDTMRLNESLQLSLSHKISNRYPAYEGRGEFTNDLYLDNNGLRGSGAIYYLNSLTVTDSIYFYPYRALAHAKTHHIYEQESPTSSPEAYVEDASIDWQAFKDKLISKNRETFYTVYREKHLFDGAMTLSPKALEASGELYFDNALTVSDEFILQSNDFTAHHSQFNLFDEVDDEKIIAGKDLYTAVSFEDDLGSFETLTDSASFELRPNKYHLYFDLMEWDMTNYTMNFSQFSEDQAWLVSVDQFQDSLSFYATEAQYDLVTHDLDVNGVGEILMPPVTILPDSSRVHILSNGKMKQLNNARISVHSDTKTEYNFYKTKLDVLNGGEFVGSGWFDYSNSEGHTQPIYFSQLKKQGDDVFGIAYLKEEDDFHLDQHFGYKGKVILDSSKDFLNFNGDTRIHQACNALNRAWIPFNDEVNPDDVFINLNPEIRLTDRQQWHAGVMLSQKPTVCYPAFLSSPKRVNDYEIMGVNGFVHFDDMNRHYVIGSEEKIENPNLPGNLAIYNPEACTLYSEGAINLGENTGLVNVGGQGWLISSIDEQTINGVVDLSFDFLMHKKAAKLIRKALKKASFGEVVDQSNELHQRMLSDQLGSKQLRKYNRKKQKGKRFLPDAFKHTFYFPQLSLIWNSKTTSFISNYEIPLNNIIGRKIDRMVPGIIEIRPRGLGDEINIYIHLSKENYYYFSYRRGVMNIISSNQEFNQLILNSPRRLSNRKGTPDTGSFKYQLGNVRQMQKFLRRMMWEE